MLPKVHPKLLNYDISQKREKDFDQVCFDGIDQFYKYFFFACFISCYWGKLPSNGCLEENYVYEALPLFFP